MKRARTNRPATHESEGALAGSSYCQFKDKAVGLDQEFSRLMEFGSTHLSYKPIAEDVEVMAISASL